MLQKGLQIQQTTTPEGLQGLAPLSIYENWTSPMKIVYFRIQLN